MPNAMYSAQHATSNRNIGSKATSRTSHSMRRGRDTGNSFGPSFKSRCCASSLLSPSGRTGAAAQQVIPILG